MAALAGAAAGCGSSGSGSGGHGGTTSSATDGGYHYPGVRARVAVLQLVLDTGQPTDQPVGPDMVVGGTVVYNAGFQTWFGTGGNGTLSPSSHVSLADEAVKAQALIGQVPKLAAAGAAHAVIASELLDAGLIAGSDLPGALDASGKVTAGPAVESWYTAHASQPLAKGSSVSLSDEAARIVAEIEKSGS
ncbi:hypothetical protein [Catenulispora acidiphila]|uniref:hypothetical protein n=1 Tax=Catenulispora acidiphila TaxID=304895 RepID=UPI00117DC738|nr:hypothetical protein [Catenulispora acidiphila]